MLRFGLIFSQFYPRLLWYFVLYNFIFFIIWDKVERNCFILAYFFRSISLIKLKKYFSIFFSTYPVYAVKTLIKRPFYIFISTKYILKRDPSVQKHSKAQFLDTNSKSVLVYCNSNKTELLPIDYIGNRVTLAQLCILLVPNFYTFLVGIYFLIFRHLSVKRACNWGFLLSGFR